MGVLFHRESTLSLRPVSRSVACVCVVCALGFSVLSLSAENRTVPSLAHVEPDELQRIRNEMKSIKSIVSRFARFTFSCTLSVRGHATAPARRVMQLRLTAEWQGEATHY